MPDNFEAELKTFLNEKFGLNPKNMDFFLDAFTHSSFKTSKDQTDYEKLEFLGDSCVKISISSCLFGRSMTLKEMSVARNKLVQSDTLSKISVELGLDKHLRVGKSCKFITKSMMEDVYESFIGAVFMAFGFEKTREIVESTLWSKFLNQEIDIYTDYKTQLQELIQATSKEKIIYTLEKTVIEEGGKKIFFVALFVGNKLVGRGQGDRVKTAEQMAAKEAILTLTY